MNYTYFRDPESDYIIITTPRNTTKFENIIANPNVSLLVHDWISAKATTSQPEESRQDTASTSSGRRNSLYELLTNLNKTEISSVSVMISGKAEILDPSSEKFDFYKSLHSNNSLIDQNQAKNYIECADNALIVIRIEGCKVTDTDNNIQEYQK